MTLPRVFMDFTVADAPLGRVVFELFSDVVPKTAENFRALCTGEKRNKAGEPLAYKGSPVHRVIEGFMLQGGDFTKRNGSGGESIYGGMFADERLEGDGTEVNRDGLLVMANRGPDTNGSQWFVTLAPAPHLTGKHVVFGRVVSGMDHIKTIGALPTDGRDRPFSPVIVSHAGELELRRPARAISPSRSPTRSRSRSPRRRGKYSDDSDSDDEERRRRRRARKERHREERRERRERRDRREEKDKKERRRRSVSESISELDARLEAEEKARLGEERAIKEEEMKARREREQKAVRESGGVVYKGRGAMRYRDPESRPTNYNPRGQDTRARYRRGDGGGRWEQDGGRGGAPRGDDEERRERDRDDRGGRRWGADKWERSAPAFERATDRWDAGRMGDGASAAREGLAARLSARRTSGEGLDYGADEVQRAVEVERDVVRDGGEGRNARAAAWTATRRESPRRSHIASPSKSERDERRSPSPGGSDMELDRD
ncbi:hypothetical protein CcaverHIS002_0301010 [Cutaneotrichosporon cavernicola]|uniref:peptidylprolyl isomerase n=1 Tax=Cutaneotrichosporon cavernicola TaxID=279322 RepID=A0AA48IGF5_9TREE|nr:uncharacterized protein CcaverHIS019_0300980 [Cutaneotrichosporon cavernicola]BEI82233.1 hypothetical protein CcaverHIS002_0301010 [Cutaneotrichosporon cavernicola]BEI90028.1 hypothetical protein CcaverHIS019_0300980 [Cutaneotrichosporon cavernicola]BEI97802.1 hypothetical protein CcaverHIS631_0301010 [Cutaneotrichosporon cavernicola]BEJ05579.1 hypothetical protein CcaverHIS641_0301010 [Cutaneotrichosporon cavernicola]